VCEGILNKREGKKTTSKSVLVLTSKFSLRPEPVYEYSSTWVPYLSLLLEL